MAPFERIKSGIPAMDTALDNIRLGGRGYQQNQGRQHQDDCGPPYNARHAFSFLSPYLFPPFPLFSLFLKH